MLFISVTFSIDRSHWKVQTFWSNEKLSVSTTYTFFSLFLSFYIDLICWADFNTWLWHEKQVAFWHFHDEYTKGWRRIGLMSILNCEHLNLLHWIENVTFHGKSMLDVFTFQSIINIVCVCDDFESYESMNISRVCCVH